MMISPVIDSFYHLVFQMKMSGHYQELGRLALIPLFHVEIMLFVLYRVKTIIIFLRLELCYFAK